MVFWIEIDFLPTSPFGNSAYPPPIVDLPLGMYLCPHYAKSGLKTSASAEAHGADSGPFHPQECFNYYGAYYYKASNDYEQVVWTYQP